MAELKNNAENKEVTAKDPAGKPDKASKKEAKKKEKAAKKKNKKPLGERIKNFFRVYKSEIKKITWTPKEQVRKNSILVLVIVLVMTVVLGLLDLVFSTGITNLAELIG